MAPAAKKRKTDASVQRFHCFSCVTDRVSTQFPDYNPTAECDHLINTCKTCLKKWVESNVEEANFATAGKDGEVFGVKCPQCDEIMKNADVQMAATKKVYERFNTLERKHIGNAIPGWRWCLSPTCPGGQVHESKALEEPSPRKRQKSRFGGVFKKKSKGPPTKEPDIFTCNECGAKACVPCDRPYHEGETCAEYQIRTKDRIEEEDQALKEIQKATKSCPSCKKRIQKNGGCPAMQCSQCHCGFCWDCLEIFSDRGCKCHRR